MIEINVNGSVVSVQQTEALYCGSRDVYICSFSFDKSWDKYRKSAVFRAAGRAITAVVAEDNSCLLPWELMQRDSIGHEIEVGMYGVGADGEILTSVWDSIGTVREGSAVGNDARDPSVGVYEQVMATLQNVDEKVNGLLSMTQRVETAGAIASSSAESAKESETIAVSAKAEVQTALESIRSALGDLPAGSTLVVNDLTTGGKSAALSAEMGKKLDQNKMSVTPVYYPAATAKSADDLLDPLAMVPINADVNPDLHRILSGTYCYIHTYFYQSIALTSRRMQVAYSYNSWPSKMAIRLYGSNGWAPWNEVITAAGGNLTGGSRLRFSENGGKVSSLRETETGFVITASLSSENEYVNYATFNFKNNGDMLIGAVGEAGSAAKWSNVLTTANKPNGSYTGNGDKTSRTIQVGGIGEVVMVRSTQGAMLVTSRGAFGMNANGSVSFGSAHVNYANGVLKLANTEDVFNKSAVEYYYQVL